jgi:hypothetical protein
MEFCRRSTPGWVALESTLEARSALEQLHLLCRDEIALIEERTALVNQLIAALYEYYPTALAAFGD